MQTLKNIIFDLGGVIINLDYHRTARAFVELGLSNFDDIYSKARQSSLFDQFEKGALSAVEFRDTLRSHLPSGLSDEAIDKAWNAMLIDIPEHRVDWLKRIGENYRIFLLSNTNEVHVNAFTKMADDKFGKGRFEALFEQHYYSCNMGMRKPDAEIFDYVVSKNNLDIDSTLFIDDSIQHVEGAKSAGLHSELLKVEQGEKIEEKYAWLL
jgi:putative hydrolase of the HAD superfamily